MTDDVNKTKEQEYIYIREETGRTCFRVLLKRDVLAGRKRNRSSISVYGISHYWLIVVYRNQMESSLWLRRNALIFFFNVATIQLEKHSSVCMVHLSPSLRYVSNEAYSKYRPAPLFPKIHIILINYMWLRRSDAGRFLLITD